MPKALPGTIPYFRPGNVYCIHKFFRSPDPPRTGAIFQQPLWKGCGSGCGKSASVDMAVRAGPPLPVPSVSRSQCRNFVHPHPSTRKEGSAIDSPLQRGQCPGPRTRSRFRNTNPQSLQTAGICTRRRPAARRLFRRCSRWSPISFSRLPTDDESSFAVRGPSSRQARIRRRTVSRSSDGIAVPRRAGLRFSGCLRVERLQELDDLAAPALRAFPFPFLVLPEGEDFLEPLAALRALEGIRGHALLLVPGKMEPLFQRYFNDGNNQRGIHHGDSP